MHWLFAFEVVKNEINMTGTPCGEMRKVEEIMSLKGIVSLVQSDMCMLKKALVYVLHPVSVISPSVSSKIVY